MWGYDDQGAPHVFVENKFWAGLTASQPVSYIRKLAECPQPTLLLVVVPQSRQQSIWRELIRRLEEARISTADRETPAGIVANVTTSLGPILALTSWNKLLDFLEVATTNNEAARSDLRQLRALCDQADDDAFIPFSSEAISDKRTPALILQLNSIVQEATTLAFIEGLLHKGRLVPQADWIRTGRYVNFFEDGRVGFWFGVHFGLWKKHEASPLWGVFSTSDWGRAMEVRALLEPWAAKSGAFVAAESDGSFAVAFDIRVGEEQGIVIRTIADRFREIGSVLSVLEPKQNPAAE
jgi:hypothetical protein